MPNIRTRTVQLKNPNVQWGVENFKQVTKYLTEHGEHGAFVIALPERWADLLQQKEVAAETLEAVDRAWDQAQKRVEELSIVQRKVICYFFKSSVIERIYDEKGEFVGNGFMSDEVSFTKGTALDFAFCVCNEVNSSLEQKKKYLRLNGDWYGDENHPLCEHVIDWTPERELFFRAFDAQLITLIKKITAFVALPKENVTALIERFGSVAALPEPKEDEKHKVVIDL